MKFALVCTMYKRPWPHISNKQNWVKLFVTLEEAQEFALKFAKQCQPDCQTLEEFQDTLSIADYFHVMDVVE